MLMSLLAEHAIRREVLLLMYSGFIRLWLHYTLNFCYPTVRFQHLIALLFEHLGRHKINEKEINKTFISAVIYFN